MNRIDGIEKAGRLVLWLAMASTFVLAPLSYFRMASAESELRRSIKDAEHRLEDALKPKETSPQRLALGEVGPMLTLLNVSMARGSISFTNVSAREGVVCAVGVVTNPDTGESTESLAACKHVAAYESNVDISFQFAGAVLGPLCKGVTCKFSPRNAPDEAPNSKSVPSLASTP